MQQVLTIVCLVGFGVLIGWVVALIVLDRTTSVRHAIDPLGLRQQQAANEMTARCRRAEEQMCRVAYRGRL
ncbi:hypothetical protein [Streptomyces prunicolor]|uniref:Uncharacterized protein n=1 Tax=Streptomyces prunicolor TaxID=67348 RepID=A0ABU4FGN6_9ACTN|nr:hypothetical protein [Streptomyces prunicolor]MDV7219158.1 hypothetical protein [Streptomyces prunicolor]